MNTKHVRRIDKTDLNRKAEKTSQGFLRAPAFATRTGVFAYRMADGSILKELRPPSEVFNVDSMKTLANVPVTNQHPKPGLLDTANAKNFTIGFTGDSVDRVEEKYLQVYVTVFDQTTMDQAEQGMQEVSCGYVCDLDPTPGIFDGEPYDVVQKNIVYNHLAIVPRGRAGPDVKLHLDADEAEMVSETEKPKGPMMEKIKIKDKEFDASPEMADAFKAHMKDMDEQMDSMKKQIDAFKAPAKGEEKAPPASDPKDVPAKDAKPAEGSKEEEQSETSEEEKAEQLKKDNDKLQAKADALEVELKKLKDSRTDSMDETKLRSLVNSRIKVLNLAARMLPKGTKLDEMSDSEIKKEIIKADSPEMSSFEGKGEEYVNARYDHIEERMMASMSGKRVMGDSIVSARNDSAAPDSEAARQRMIAESKEAYKKHV